MCGGGPFCGNAVNSVTESASPVTLNVYRSPSNQIDRPSPFVRATSCVFILLKFRTRSRTIFNLEALLNTSEYLEPGSRRARISRGKRLGGLCLSGCFSRPQYIALSLCWTALRG